MQKHLNLSKRALAMILVVAMLLPVFSSLSMLGVFASEEDVTTLNTTTDGKIVAENYVLTEEEKVLLKSGYLIGATHNYRVPTASDDLISIDTDTKTVTAKSFEETAGYLWNPVSAEIVVNVSGTETVEETITFTNNKASYTTTATAFAVRVKYEVRKEISSETQELLLNAPEYLKQGVTNLDTLLDPKGDVMKALDSFATFSLTTLGADTHNPNAGTKGVLQLLLDDGYNYPFTFGPAGNQQTTTISIRFFDAIQTANEGMKYSEQEAAAELVAQLNANDGKLNLAVIAAEYAAASSKVEYLAQNAARVKEEVVKTYDLLYALTDDNGTLLGTLSWGGMFAVAGAFKTALETYVGYIVSLAGDKTYDKGALKVNEIGALEAYCADDAWKIIGKDILKDGLVPADYLSLDIMVGKLGDDLKGASAVVTNPLVVDTAVVQFNMSMYDVKVNVTLKVTEDELGSANEIVYEKKTVTLTLAQNATKQEILSAIDTSKAEQNALAAWNDVFVEGKFDRTVSALPDTLTGDIEYNITYTPKQYTVILNGVDLTLPYGYQLVLPVHEDATQSYDYWANGEYYAQGKVVTVVDDTVITRGEGKAYTPYAISMLISNTYFAENAKASAILNSGALNAGLANDVANVRVPEAGDGLVTLNGSKLTASSYASSYQGFDWTPYTYTVVTDGGETVYEFNGADSVVITEDFVRVEVSYRLNLTNIASEDVKDLLDLVVTLSDEAAAQKAALDRLNNYYGMMGKDTISVGILNGLKSFIPTCSDISEESKTNLINAIDGVINNCFEGESLRMYVLLTGYRNDGLAYYYKNSEAFMNEINLLGEYLGGIVSEEEALRTVIDSLNLGDGISAQVDKISNLEGAIAELKAALTAPNAAIDTNSANLEKLTDALEVAGDVTYDYNGETLYLTAGPFVRDAETKVSVQVTVQGSVLPTFTFNKNHVLTANDVKAITDAIAATVAEKNLSDKYYSTNYKADEFAQSLIGKEATALGTTSFVFSYEPKEYTVTIEGVGDATIGIGNLKVTLPASDRPLEYRYDYYVNGVKVNGSSYTFSMAQFDAIIAAGGFTIQREVIDVKEEEYKNLINEFNDAIGSDLIVFALTKNNGEYAIILKLDTSNPGALAGAVKALAMKLVNYSYVAFEDNAFIYDDNGSKISFQALINTIMDSGFGSDTLIGMMNKNGVINNMKMPGEVISDKKVSAAGALLAETEFRLGLSKDQLSYQIPMYITMGAAPEYLTQLRNLLAEQLAAYFTFECVNGKAVLSFNMPQKAYEAYLAVLLATDNVDITDVNAINEDVAIGFLENVIRPLMLSDASASSVENTLKKFGFNINFSEYEQAFEYIRSFYKKSSFAYDDLESTYDMGLDISIAEYLESMDLGNLSGMIVEKDSGIHVDLGVSLVNLDKDYEALFFDIGAQGIANKFGLVEDVASKLGSMSGTAVVILLSDVDSNLTFKTTTVLNLNGFTVNGNIVGKGSVRIVDSVVDEGACGAVNGKISGNVLIAGGKYTTDVTAFIPNGYEQDADGVVSNKFMTIVRDEDGNINVEFNAGILATNSIPDIKTLIADIGVEILLNGFTANKLYFNDKKVYELTVDDLVGLYSATNRQEALMQKAMNMIDRQDLVDIINILLDNLTDFEGMKNVLDQDIANGTETPLFTYDLITGTWGFSVEYVEEDDSITADITTGQDQKRKLNIVLTGDTADKQYVADLLGILVETAEKADMSVQVAAGKKSSTVTVNVGLIADVRFDFSKDAKYAVMLSVIVADGIGAPANAGLVAGLKTYFETDDMSDLTKAFNKLTLAQLVTAVENFQRNDTFAGMLNKLGLGGYDTTDAAALGADLDRFAKVLGILARRVDVTGPAIKLESALDATTYAYTLDKENIKRSFNLDLVAGYSATLTAELVDVFASVKIFNDPSAPVVPTIDYGALEAEIQRIESLGLVEGDYTAETWSTFQAAMDAAKALIGNATSQDEVDTALKALIVAVEGLQKAPGVTKIDYSMLRLKLLRLEVLGLVEDEYTETSWSVFKAAWDAAKALLDNANSQAEVDAALATLATAFEGLTKKAPVAPTIDYIALQAEIQRIEALNLVEDEYTATSWSVFKAAMDAAKALINNATAQGEVDAALATLTAAANNLVKKAPPVTPTVIYTALQVEIQRIKGLGLAEDDYTPASWSVFKAAMDAAEALIDNANSQAEVDAALATLTAAFNALVKKTPVAPTIDYSALNAEIQRIEALNLVEDEYTATSWSVFKAAMDAAKALINNATTQAEVDAALATLTAAVDGLTKKPVAPTIDYNALQAEIQRIEALNLVEDEYTTESWAAFKVAMDAAKALINNATTQAEVDSVLATLTTAANGLVKKTPATPSVDLGALEAEIQRIEALALVEGEYTAESWAAYKAAYDAAKALLANATTQAEVDAALAALTAAANALVKKTPVTPAIDYSALNAEIQRIEALALVEGDYTAESWAAFKAAMDAAKALIDNAGTQAEVDSVLAALTAAVNGLQKKAPVTPPVDGGDGPTEKPTDKEEDEGLGVIWIIIIVAVSIVVVAGVAAIIVLNIKKKKTTDSTPLVDYNIDDDNA